MQIPRHVVSKFRGLNTETFNWTLVMVDMQGTSPIKWKLGGVSFLGLDSVFHSNSIYHSYYSHVIHIHCIGTTLIYIFRCPQLIHKY